MKKALIFSFILNFAMFVVITTGGVYCYMAFTALQKQVASAQELAKVEIANMKQTFESGKAQLFSEYKEIKQNTIYKNSEEIHSNLKFANDLLDLVQGSGGVIVNENAVWKDKKVAAAEWAGRARAEAKLLALAYDGQEILSRLTSTKFGDDWKISLDGEKPVRLYEWLYNSELVQSTTLNKQRNSDA